jgi:hypothetical protein
MKAFMSVESWLSGAGEIGISFLRGRVRAVAEAVLLLNVGDGN